MKVIDSDRGAKEGQGPAYSEDQINFLSMKYYFIEPLKN